MAQKLEKQQNIDTTLMNNIENFPLTIESDELLTLIPHRYPFLLIDRIERVILGESAVGIKNVSINEQYFQGHFPNHPIMPGVLVIEALAQTAAALVMKTLMADGGKKEAPSHVYFMSIEKAKFRKPVLPGQVLKLHVQKEKSRGPVWQFKGEAFVNGILTDEAIFTAMINN